MFKPAEQTMTDNKPQFSVAELLKAAQLAGIDPASLPANANPWTLQGDSRAFAWQSAFRSLNPAMAQEAEISYGPPLSLALQAALDGIAEMTADLAGELAVKRPHQHEQMRREQVEAALNRIAEAREEEADRRAKATPSPEALRQQLLASREAAAAHIRSLNGIPDASDA
jgi:hypothetical protein